ncbi:MAG: hypothetical protein WDM79_02185 [Terricaulis sp.]
MSGAPDNPFDLLRLPDVQWQEGLDPVRAAIAAFDPEHPEPLGALLNAEDPLITRRALSVFGSVGKKGFVVLDAALALAGHRDMLARSKLLDGVLSYPRRLNPTQAHIVLQLGVDAEDIVREKVVAFISLAKLETLEHAIALFSGSLRDEHEEGLRLLKEEHEDIQRIFDVAIATNTLHSIYGLAALERMARKGLVDRFPSYSGGSYLGASVLANMQRLHKLHRKTGSSAS